MKARYTQRAENKTEALQLRNNKTQTKTDLISNSNIKMPFELITRTNDRNNKNKRKKLSLMDQPESSH